MFLALFLLFLALSLTPEQRSLRARIAANTRWSRESGRPNAIRGQRGLYAKFEKQVDPEGRLSPVERAKRTEAAYRAHMARLALKSSKARASRKTESGVADDAA
jgi:hypothetical protein